jgi:hypothetical protein|tara:strand:- start:7370 stop:7486 length:117 start_codon:yes stop_codon:yes gene_type:complete
MQNNTDMHKERFYEYLVKKYGRTVISKTQMPEELEKFW